MSFLQKVNDLKRRTFPPEQQILTIYLNTEPERARQAPWRIRLKNGMNRLMQYAAAKGMDEQVRQLSRLQRQLEKSLEDQRAELKNGLVVVACPLKGILLLEKLQVAAPNSFYWETAPVLDELEALLEQYPAAGIVMVGSDTVTVLDTTLGEVDREWKYEWHQDTEDWRPYRGVASADRQASGASHKDRFDKRLDANRQRWMKRLAPILKRHEQRNHWHEIVLTGESGLTADLAKELNTRPPRLLAKNMSGMPAHQVIQEVYM